MRRESALFSTLLLAISVLLFCVLVFWQHP
jgi:hypothetical protein